MKPREAREFLPTINNCKTLRELDTFIENARKKNREDVVELAYARRAVLSIKEAISEGRRPHLNYFEMGLKVDDFLIHARTGEQSKVYSGRQLIYKGRICYISPLEEELTEKHKGKSQPGGPSNHWTTADGRLLNDLYEATYGPKREA